MKWIALAAVIGGCQCGSAPEAAIEDAPRRRDAMPDADDGRPHAHKDFPSARAAGTENLFTLEEPDRGPRAPTAYVLPPKNDLKWEEGLHCEDDTIQPACTKTFAGDRYPWRVGRSPTLIAAEWMWAGRIHQTLLYERDAAGKPTRQIVLDQYGQVVTARMFVEPGKYSERQPNGANALSGCGFVTFELDDRGFSTRRNCVQWNGAGMRDTHNVGSHAFVRDAHGLAIADRNAGIDGFPVVDETGVYETRIERAARDGRVVARRFFDAAGAPVTATSGCTGELTAWDDHGDDTQHTCVDAAGAPVPRVAGWAIERLAYSNLGCKLGARYFAAGGAAPATTPDGIHGYDYIRDAHCAEIQTLCVGPTDHQVPCGFGQPAKIVVTRDAKGRELTAKHYDLLGAETPDASYGAFEVRQVYDAVGNPLVQSCWDSGGAPSQCGLMGFHALHLVYDDAGRQIEHRFTDPHELPATNLGTATRKFRYDNYDHLVETRNFDVTGRPFEISGYALRRDIWDTAHRRAGFLMFDRNEAPVGFGPGMCIAGATCPTAKWHAVRILRRVDGSPISNEFFDENKQLIEAFECTSAKCFN